MRRGFPGEGEDERQVNMREAFDKSFACFLEISHITEARRLELVNACYTIVALAEEGNHVVLFVIWRRVVGHLILRTFQMCMGLGNANFFLWCAHV